MAKIKVDLDDIFRRGTDIRLELEKVIMRVVQKRVPLLELITEKGNPELKKRALLFLTQSHIRRLYHRIEKDEKNSNHILVHFRLQSNRKTIGLYGHPSILKK